MGRIIHHAALFFPSKRRLPQWNPTDPIKSQWGPLGAVSGGCLTAPVLPLRFPFIMEPSRTSVLIGYGYSKYFSIYISDLQPVALQLLQDYKSQHSLCCGFVTAGVPRVGEHGSMESCACILCSLYEQSGCRHTPQPLPTLVGANVTAVYCTFLPLIL